MQNLAQCAPKTGKQTVCMVVAPVLGACSEVDNPASVKELFALVPTIEPGGENI